MFGKILCKLKIARISIPECFWLFILELFSARAEKILPSSKGSLDSAKTTDFSIEPLTCTHDLTCEKIRLTIG